MAIKLRRGTRNTMYNTESSNIILEKGEIFMEAPDTGVGTGEGGIKVGDGETKYKDLPYFITPKNIVSTVTTNDSKYAIIDENSYNGMVKNKDLSYFVKPNNTVSITKECDYTGTDTSFIDISEKDKKIEELEKEIEILKSKTNNQAQWNEKNEIIW